MPAFNCVVNFTGDFNGVKFVKPIDGRSWMIKVQCSACQTVSPNFVEVDPDAVAEEAGGDANAMWKCKECKRGISASVVPRTQAAVESKGGSVVQIEVRGGDPVELLLDDRWTAVGDSEDETEFTNVDLSDAWVDYDEKAGVPVEISGATVTFARAK